MRVLLDTNILIHREANRVIHQDIGMLFYWLDRLGYQQCIHPLSLTEIQKYHDPQVVQTILTKIKNYHTLKTLADDSPEIRAIRLHDHNDNDTIDTSILNELHQDRVDLLITEDRALHRKARTLGIADRVYTIDAFLEKVIAEHPELTDYNVLAVKKSFFGEIDINDPFFDSFKHDYHGFEKWFNRKADEIAYICRAEEGRLLAFLYVKTEDRSENYTDITPSFASKKRLKVGTFKVIANGYKLGERFVKIIIDNAMKARVDDIYVTIFSNTPEQERLIYLLQDWGFVHHGIKKTTSGTEQVYVRDFTPRADPQRPALTYPFLSRSRRKFIVPIYPEYHTELFPDSILRTESPDDFVENRPNRNAISKVYISRSIRRDLAAGDIIIFYRTKVATGHAYYTSVVTTLGVVQSIATTIPNLATFLRLCRKRSVFSDDELAKHWHYNPRNHPFIVNFLYVHTLHNKLNLKELKELHIIDEAPRGFELLTDAAFETLLEHSHAHKRIIVD